MTDAADPRVIPIEPGDIARQRAASRRIGEGAPERAIRFPRSRLPMIKALSDYVYVESGSTVCLRSNPAIALDYRDFLRATLASRVESQVDGDEKPVPVAAA